MMCEQNKKFDKEIATTQTKITKPRNPRVKKNN